ncbi:hypothetical protein FRC10_007732 [Ceratobasidium sp. 414]|nr:hypothetical protein FRC10_007732 [Ceratobasidium sp. 414]
MLPPEILLWLDHSISKRTPTPQNPVEALKEYLEALTLAKYLMVAACTLLIYDMINFQPRLTAKLSLPRCEAEIRVIAALGIFSNSVMMCILGLRVWAIWGREYWMLAILSLIFLSSNLPPAILIGGEIQKLIVIDNPLPGILTGCVVIYQSNLGANWVRLYVCVLIYDSALFVLTLLRAWILHRRGVGTPIMALLTWDGAWYFLVTVVSVSLTIVGTSLRKTEAAALLSLFFIAIMASAGSRLLLRLRGFYEPTDQGSRREWIQQSGDIAMRDYSSRSNGQSAPKGGLEVFVCTTTDGTLKADV